MTETHPALARSPGHVRRVLGVSFLVYAVIGYSLYFATLAQPGPPAWAIEAIDQLKPTLRALETAARLSDRPFPMQVVIVYAVISSVLLTVYYVYCAFFVTHIRHEFYQHQCELVKKLKASPSLRRKVAVFGVLMLLAFGFIYPILFFGIGGWGGDHISWRVAALFSSSVLSVSFLLLLTGAAVLGFLISPWAIYVSILCHHCQ
jgi:hypothetical protein